MRIFKNHRIRHYFQIKHSQADDTALQDARTVGKHTYDTTLQAPIFLLIPSFYYLYLHASAAASCSRITLFLSFSSLVSRGGFSSAATVLRPSLDLGKKAHLCWLCARPKKGAGELTSTSCWTAKRLGSLRFLAIMAATV